MRQDQFIRRFGPEWEVLAEQLDALENKPTQASDLDQFPARYRRLCQHYALARSRAYSPSLTERLHRMVLRAHQCYYLPRRPWAEQLVDFLLRGYPRLVRNEWRFVTTAALAFFGTMLALILGVQAFPDLVYTVLDPDAVRSYESMYDPQLQRRIGREDEADSDFLMFGFYIRNNTSIGFQTFAGGLLMGLGTLFYLIYNGVFIGAVAGHLTQVGYGTPFWSFVSGHSAFELTAIALSGAAGLRMGWALLAPGRKSRRLALRDAAAVGVRLIYGASTLFLLAAFVEAFWSSQVSLPAVVKYAVGMFLWALLLIYLSLFGRQGARRRP